MKPWREESNAADVHLKQPIVRQAKQSMVREASQTVDGTEGVCKRRDSVGELDPSRSLNTALDLAPSSRNEGHRLASDRVSSARTARLGSCVQ